MIVIVLTIAAWVIGILSASAAVLAILAIATDDGG